MKRFMKRTDLTALWEEDGDLKRMKAFFHTLEADSEEKEHIKQSIKQKALEKMAKEEEREGSPMTGKEGLVQRIRTRLRAMSKIGRWKLGISVAGLAILVIIGQGALNVSWHLFPQMGSSAKSTQSMERAPQVTGSIGAGGEANDGAPNDGSTAREGAAPKTSSSSTATPSTKGTAIAPFSSIQAEVPLADAGIPRKITHDLTLTLEVATINDTITRINREVQQQGGYVVESQQSGSESQSSAHMLLKIPADKLDMLRDALPAWGKVLDQCMTANDITNQYYDSQVRMQTLEAEEKRYLEILNQAKTVDDVLKVENALGNIRQQIEHLKGQLKLWNYQADYSTVNLSLVTLQSPNVNVSNPWQPISWSKTWKATQDAVLKTISSTWNLLNYLVVGMGYALPYFLIGVLGWIAYYILKKNKSE